jgi:phage/plasmid-like protein (TIGR03299 family)
LAFFYFGEKPMAHLVEQMAYSETGPVPWHGLGNKLAVNQPLEVWAQQAGMDWDILESPVHYIARGSDYTGELLHHPDNKVLYRSDTNAPLSVVGHRYKVVQPSEILEFYRDLTEVSGFELETAGVLKGGRKFWALARTGQTSTLKGNDITNGYVLLATACDGTLATTAQFTSIRVVCNNTLAVALGDSTGAVKVPHNTTFDAPAVKQQLGLSVSSWNEFMSGMKMLSERKVNSRGANAYFQRVFSEQKPSGLIHTNTSAMKKSLSLFEGHGKGSSLSSSKNTAFGLLNAVTEYVDHERRAKTNGHRLESAWFGQGANVKQKALEQALLLTA